IEYRAALRGESMERLPELLFYPRRMDGSEILLSDQLAAAFGEIEPRAAQIDLRPFHPAPASEPPTADPRADRMLPLRPLLRRPAPVVSVVPPIQKAEPHLRPYVSAIAREFPVWDFGDAPLPPPMFRDTTHLSKEGRALFSRLLATETVRAGLMPVFSRRE